MAQVSAHSAGRPGSAVLILGAIFATALLLRVPIGPAPAEQAPSGIDVRRLEVWAAAPVASMDPPVSARQISAQPRRILAAPASILEPVQVTRVASMNDTAVPEVSPRRAMPMDLTEPILTSTPQNHLAGFAAPVTQVFLVESSSGPFGVVGNAVGTAFVKTGAALTLAFKKTGQGILAPF